MRRWGAVLLVVGAIGGPASAFAQQAPAKAPTPSGMQATDKASPKLMVGKVTHVDGAARSFTIVAQGKEYRFTAGKSVALPKVGDVVDVGYTGDSGGPMEAVKLNSSRSNAY